LESLESLKLQTNLKTAKEFEYNFETRFEKKERKPPQFLGSAQSLSLFSPAPEVQQANPSQPTLAQPRPQGVFCKNDLLPRASKHLPGTSPALRSRRRVAMPAAAPGRL
jgi:hypothetical protein